MTTALHKLRISLAEAIEHDELSGTDYTKNHRILRREHRAVCRTIRRLERLERRRARAMAGGRP